MEVRSVGAMKGREVRVSEGVRREERKLSGEFGGQERGLETLVRAVCWRGAAHSSDLPQNLHRRAQGCHCGPGESWTPSGDVIHARRRSGER